MPAAYDSEEEAYDVWPGCYLGTTGSHSSSHYSCKYRLSEQLRAFLNAPSSAQMSIGAIEEGIIDYARTHNGITNMVFHYDIVIWTVLGLNATTELKLYHLEKYIRNHIFKPITIFTPKQGTDILALVENV